VSLSSEFIRFILLLSLIKLGRRTQHPRAAKKECPAVWPANYPQGRAGDFERSR